MKDFPQKLFNTVFKSLKSNNSLLVVSRHKQFYFSKIQAKNINTNMFEQIKKLYKKRTGFSNNSFNIYFFK